MRDMYGTDSVRTSASFLILRPFRADEFVDVTLTAGLHPALVYNALSGLKSSRSAVRSAAVASIFISFCLILCLHRRLACLARCTV